MGQSSTRGGRIPADRWVIPTGLDKNGSARSISSYSIPRRVTYILRRATQKFSYDIAVWLAYVDYARSEKMTKVVQIGLTA